MGRVVKRVAVISFFVIIFVVMAYYKYMDTKVYYNDADVNGNTIGNLYGKGLFCEKDGVVYFANPMDSNALYQMNPDESDVKKICRDKIFYINADDHYIYYSRDNSNIESNMSFLNVNTTSLCRIKHNGEQVTILDDGICSTLSLSNNTLFYHHYDEQEATTTYSIDIDGENKKQLYKFPVDPRCMVNDSLYYSGVESDHNIHLRNVKSGADNVICLEWTWMPTVINRTMYFMDLDENNRVAMMSLDGGEKTLITTYGTSEYNVAGNYLYYQSIKADVDGLYRVNLATLEEELIAPGEYNSINVTSRYVYFNDYYTDTCMHVSVSGGAVSPFTPPVIEDKK